MNPKNGPTMETVSSNLPLRFKVAPHIVEDLGLNLYTSLPRVLVEFIANAYDADSPSARITMDRPRITEARKILKAQWELANDRSTQGGQPVQRLETMTLPEDVSITIEDSGHGMSRDDLNDKFLVAGRRRRSEKGNSGQTPGGRIVMGRKGLGKLAGFGVAKVVTIETRCLGEKHATRIQLAFDELVKVRDTNEIEIQETRLTDGGGFARSGTRIILSKLLYEPMGSRLATIENSAAEHFTAIDPDEFEILLNNERVVPTHRSHVYAWPQPELHVSELVERTYPIENQTFSYRYRIRFVEDRSALPAKERGIRIYAHKRLAAAPSLLEADTNMHGFRMTDYMDGVVYADFIDDQPEDYIATDRQSLRWESPLLSPMYEQLSGEIKSACYERQKARDKEKEAEVTANLFTQNTIKEASLTEREKQVAWKLAVHISSLHKKGFDDENYQTQFKEVVDALGRGDLMSTLAELAKEASPEFDRVVTEVTRLTGDQLDGYYKYAKARLDGIQALRKIVLSVDFRANKNEKRLHKLLKDCPWLIDPSYFEFLASDQTEKAVFKLLEKELKVDGSTREDYDATSAEEVDAGGTNERPDLVFLIGNPSYTHLVIVELKAPNTPLYGEHYRQLEGYISDAEKWFKRHYPDRTVKIEGFLIGSFAPIASKARDVEWLHNVINKKSYPEKIQVFGIDRVLERAQTAHFDLMKVGESMRNVEADA